MEIYKLKYDIKDLALNGGKPAFTEPLHVGSPNIGSRKRLFELINDVLDRKWLTNRGVYVQEFEKKIAEMIGVRHCIAMCNGTIALEITTRALGFSGEVIVPSFTFVATAHSLQWQAITPVFCDINPDTFNIDPISVEKMITPRTTGIIGVHLWGRACNVTELTQIAQKHNLQLIFDAAHALGCSYRGKMIGCFGQAEVLSFHATKFFNTFEGGAVVTNNDQLADKIRLMKNFGFSGKDHVIHIGTNGKMNEISAVMGLTSLESMSKFIDTNFQNYLVYKKELGDTPGIRLLSFDENERSNYQYIVIIIDEKVAGISRDQLMNILHAENIIARRYFFPGCHQMEPYRSYFPHAGLMLPHTENLKQKVLSLPTGTAIGKTEIIQICDIIKLAIAQRAEIL